MAQDSEEGIEELIHETNTMDEEQEILTPSDFVNVTDNFTENLLPNKSKEKYLQMYNNFISWQQSKNTSSFSENVLLAFFKESSKNLKPSTLWSNYSMLRSTIAMNHNLDISKYYELIAYLKKNSVGFSSKKSQIFTSEQIQKFIETAPNEKYLVTKVACIFGVAGACRRDELTNLTIDNIETHGDVYLVKIPDTKTHRPRSFVITGQFHKIVKNYLSLRPKDSSKRLFLNYQRGKCTKQPIGINKIGQYPKEIAEFLELPNPILYTSHSFRRSSATLLANNDADIITLKRHGGSKSDTVAEGHIKDRINNKKKIASIISNAIKDSSNNTVKIVSESSNDAPVSESSNDAPNTIPNLSNTTINSTLSSNTDKFSIDINEEFNGSQIHFNFSNCNVTITNSTKKN